MAERTVTLELDEKILTRVLAVAAEAGVPPDMLLRVMIADELHRREVLIPRAEFSFLDALKSMASPETAQIIKTAMANFKQGAEPPGEGRE